VVGGVNSGRCAQRQEQGSDGFGNSVVSDVL
jgi:hypothetical protein